MPAHYDPSRSQMRGQPMRATNWNLTHTLATTGVALIVAVVSLLVFLERRDEQNYQTEKQEFAVAADRAGSQVLRTFEAWQHSTAEDGQLLTWQGKDATVLWVDRWDGYLQASYTVWATTANHRHFTIRYVLDDQGNLPPAGEFREWKPAEFVRALTAFGKGDAVEKLRLARSPA